MITNLDFRTFHGNTTYFPVQVRYANSKALPDLTGATITIEWETAAGVHQPPISVLPTVPGAVWSEGLVMLPFSETDITAAVGTYPYSLTIVKDGQTTTYAQGVVEVAERNGYPPPP